MRRDNRENKMERDLFKTNLPPLKTNFSDSSGLSEPLPLPEYQSEGRDLIPLDLPPAIPSSEMDPNTLYKQPSDLNHRFRDLSKHVDMRNLSPREMAEVSMDLYVAGILVWEEYATLAFQPELHPAYENTIGALTGEKAEPDRTRDFIEQWEQRLLFEKKYNRDHPDLIDRTKRIVYVLRQVGGDNGPIL